MLLFLLPVVALAKNKFPNPCDSLNRQYTYASKLTTADVMSLCDKALTSHILDKRETIKAVKLNDSTIVAECLFVIDKQPCYTSRTWGRCCIPHYSDGDFTCKMILSVRSGTLYLETLDVNHTNCKNALGDICKGEIKDNYTIVKGVAVSIWDHVTRVQKHIISMLELGSR